MKNGDTTYVMKQYWFVMLVRGESTQEFSKAELDSIQAGHMANINRCADLGKLLVAGPFGDQSDWRGILVFDVETQAEVEELLKEDTAIHSGRLKAVIHPWWTAKGTVLK